MVQAKNRRARCLLALVSPAFSTLSLPHRAVPVRLDAHRLSEAYRQVFCPQRRPLALGPLRCYLPRAFILAGEIQALVRIKCPLALFWRLLLPRAERLAPGVRAFWGFRVLEPPRVPGLLQRIEQLSFPPRSDPSSPSPPTPRHLASATSAPAGAVFLLHSRGALVLQLGSSFYPHSLAAAPSPAPSASAVRALPPEPHPHSRWPPSAPLRGGPPSEVSQEGASPVAWAPFCHHYHGRHCRRVQH